MGKKRLLHVDFQDGDSLFHSEGGRETAWKLGMADREHFRERKGSILISIYLCEDTRGDLSGIAWTPLVTDFMQDNKPREKRGWEDRPGDPFCSWYREISKEEKKKMRRREGKKRVRLKTSIKGGNGKKMKIWTVNLRKRLDRLKKKKKKKKQNTRLSKSERGKTRESQGNGVKKGTLSLQTVTIEGA